MAHGAVRKANVEDASRIAEINIFGWRYAYRGIVDTAFLFTTLNVEKSAQSTRKSLENLEKELYVFEEDAIIKGMIRICPCRDDDKKDSFELCAIYVDPLMLRQGIGHAMLAFCEEEAMRRHYKENVIWVLEKNAHGIEFYEKNGYRPDGTRKEIDFLHVTELRYTKALQ